MNVRIEKLVYGGEGLGHHEGQTVFVPFVLPEEVVAVRAVERKKKFVRGQLVEIVTRSPGRAVPPCPHFTACGGCHYQHISYEDQLRFKSGILRETLRRLGRVEWNGPIETRASPPFGYRNRAQWKLRPLGDKTAVGYFRAGSQALCEVQDCAVLSPRLAEALAALRGLAASGKLPPTQREVEAFVDAEDSRLLLNASVASFQGSPHLLAETLRGALPGAETILLHESSSDRFELFGPGFITYRVAGIGYRVGHLSFFQANRFLVDGMARAVAEDACGRLARSRLALDLFAGVGLFAVPLARGFERVVAVESNADAARDLTANLEANARNAQAVSLDVEQFLANFRESPDLVVLDPPRAGVSALALERLLALAPAEIAYFSCDPATLARDLNRLISAGFAIREVRLFDLFPQTYHIESLVRLSRAEPHRSQRE
jgi:23S rRNA (uracil1939-C5)-methyltransferase